MADTRRDPLSSKRLAEYGALAAQIATDPWVLSDCEGWLKIWRESALTHVTRDETGEVTGFSEPSSYRATDLIVETGLDSWDPGEDDTDDQVRSDISTLFTAREALPALLAEIDRLNAVNAATWRERGERATRYTQDVEKLTARVVELEPYERLSPQQCPKGLHADWLVDSEYAHACPWCQIERLKAETGRALQLLMTGQGAEAAALLNEIGTEPADDPDDNRRRIYLDGKGQAWIDSGIDDDGTRYASHVQEQLDTADPLDDIRERTGSLREIGRTR